MATHQWKIATEPGSDELRQRLYDQIKRELGSGTIPIYFTVLGLYPKLLEIAWSQLSPGVRTRALLNGVQTTRATALRLMQENFPPPASLVRQVRDAVTAREFAQTASFYLPIMQMIVAYALRYGNASIQGSSEPADLPKYPTLTVKWPPEETLPASLQDIYPRIRKAFGMAFTPHGYRTVESWSTLLAAGWEGFEAALKSDSFPRVEEELNNEFKRQARSLPIRVDTIQVMMERAGMSAQDQREVDDSLQFFYTASPKIILNFAYYYALLLEKEKLERTRA